MLIIFSILAFISTFLGGLFALKFKDKLHLILGFSAGAVIGAAFFDLIPEAIELGSTHYDVHNILVFIALSFVVYMILDRFFFHHSHDDTSSTTQEHSHTNKRGILGASSLIIHSFLDGIAIGLAFQVSVTVGIIVAVAVLVHAFSDGINTVGIILKNNGDKIQSLKWLLVGSFAPILGIISTNFFSVPASSLGIVLALFAGFFLYIGASDLLPESHHDHPTVWTTIATILGMIVIYIVVNFAHA